MIPRPCTLIGAFVPDLLRPFKAAIIIGKERQLVADALTAHAPDVAAFEIEDGPEVMARAVAKAKAIAEPGDIVLLAPAAASMDQFKDYADRGNQFAKAVLG